ncbi:uncharacterized protein F5147DRAFT_838217 [Suillus discolor]|uniref:DUF6533 domain-containing protein n=1 Tax=Suillus discolor TaxID=1912936 RepID=A0A9P7F2Y3_9AGAM|nr:uncharacterized protein F5147DRAFT_838217 [Suillus discolor]KAG2104661.1 hypothetical protein F5147DRAFT_838217 [Suillus discolor]
MTFISNDPSYWPHISWNIFLSYWTVAAVVVMLYDWVLTLSGEIELIWVSDKSSVSEECNQFAAEKTLVSHYRALFDYTLYWNTIFCYLCSTVYAIGIADRWSAITDYAVNGSIVILTDMLGVIMISRLHVMYQGSRKMLMFLVIIFLAVNIFCAVIVAIALHETVMEEMILSDMHTCDYGIGSEERFLISMAWGLNTVWEVLALCLSVWVAVKHFRDLRQLGPSTGSTLGDWFRVLIQSHALYFASFVGVSCLHLAALSPKIAKSDIGVSILGSALQIFMVIQMFVLGPRLILSIREHHAKLVAYSDAETTMNSIVFQEDVHGSTSSTV